MRLSLREKDAALERRVMQSIWPLRYAVRPFSFSSPFFLSRPVEVVYLGAVMNSLPENDTVKYSSFPAL